MSKYISASEVNRYVYCNYQWYYEKKYGRKKIVEIAKKKYPYYKNSEIKKNFIHGSKFHKKYKDKRSIVPIIILISIIVVILWFYFI
ncbi:MAG: hypothetical protein ACK5LT_03495 [Lachnospirales bacterium]